MADTPFNSLNPQLSNLFTNLEGQYNLPAGLLQSVAYTESRYNNNATSKTGAQGMFQFMPATAKQYNVDVSDPVSSANGAAKMYSDLLKANGGDLNKALAGYNWGQGNLNKNGLANAPAETKAYISQINGLMNNQGNGGSNQNLNSGAGAPSQEAINAYISMMKAQQGGQQQANNQPSTQDGAPPQEAINAYINMMKGQMAQAQQQPAPQQPSSTQIFVPNQDKLNNQEGMGPIQLQQNPVQLQQSQQGLGVAQQQQGQVQNNMNAQSGNIAYNPQNNARSTIYNQLLQYANDPNKMADFYSSLSPNEKQYVNEMIHAQYLKTNNGQEQGALQNLWEGVARSAQKTVNSVNQIGGAIASGITGNQSYVNNADDQARRAKAIADMNEAQNPSTARSVGEIGGDIGQFLLGGEVLGGAKATGALAKGGAELAGITNPNAIRAVDLGLQGAGSSVLQNPVDNAQNAKDVLAGKAIQGVTGAGAGAIGGMAAEKVLGGVAQRINTARNIGNELPLADQQAIAQANAQGIPLLANDLPSANVNLIKKGQDLTNSSGTVNEAVGKQQQALNQATQNVLNTVGKPDASKIAQETGMDKVLQNSDSPYFNKALEVQNKIENINPNDPNAILKASAEAQLIGKKDISNQLYSKAEALAPQDAQVPLNNATKVAQDAQSFLDNLTTPTQKNQFKGVVNDLQSIIDNSANGNNSFAQVNQFFREVGDNARQAMRSGDEQGARFYNQFKTALNQDKQDFINSLPDSSSVQAYKNAYDQATSYNKENIQSIKNNNMGTLFEPYNKNGTPNIPDGLIDKWVKKGDISKVQTVFDNLPPTGQQAVQQGVINKITANAFDANGNVIPSKLMSNYNSYIDPTSGNTPLSVVLTPDAKTAFDNLMSTMGRLQNIGVYKANPQTGVKALPSLGNIETMGAILAAPHTHGLSLLKVAGDFLKSGLVAKGLTDPTLQKYLININNINTSKPAFLNAVGSLSTYIAQNYLNNKGQ